MMSKSFLVVVSFCILSLSFFEVLIFNDEIFLAICFLAFIFTSYFHFSALFSSAFQKRSRAAGLNLFSCLVPHFNILYCSSLNNILSNFIPQADRHFNELSALLRTCSIFNYNKNLFCILHAEVLMASPFTLLESYYAIEIKAFYHAQGSLAQTVLFFLRPILITTPNYFLPTPTHHISRCVYLHTPSDNVDDFYIGSAVRRSIS